VKNYATIDSKTSSTSDDVLINKKLLKTTSRKSTKLGKLKLGLTRETKYYNNYKLMKQNYRSTSENLVARNNHYIYL
jgi:hypothetical protein